MARRGFTLIEILIMVAIIGVMMAVAVTSVASGQDAARSKAAARGVAQMSHYATALALLRQRPVVLSFTGGKIDVQISGDPPKAVGELAEPIYMNDVNGERAVVIAEMAPEEKGAGLEGSEEGEPATEKKSVAEKTGLFFTQQILNPDELAKEDATREFEGVAFDVEVMGDEGQELDDRTKTTLESQAEAMVAARKKAIAAWSNTSGEIDTSKKEAEKEEEEPFDPTKPTRVIYETNGNCTPYRVIVRAVEDGKPLEEELMVINVARTGKVTIEDEESESTSSRRRNTSRRSKR